MNEIKLWKGAFWGLMFGMLLLSMVMLVVNVGILGFRNQLVDGLAAILTLNPLFWTEHFGGCHDAGCGFTIFFTPLFYAIYGFIIQLVRRNYPR